MRIGGNEEQVIGGRRNNLADIKPFKIQTGSLYRQGCVYNNPESVDNDKLICHNNPLLRTAKAAAEMNGMCKNKTEGIQ